MKNFNVKTLIFLNLGLAATLTTLFFTGFKGDEKNIAQASLNGDKTEQTVRSFDLKNKDFNFCGEVLPMDNFDVMQRLDKELLRNAYYHSSTILAIKRANAVFPIIEPILAKNGLPDDLKYLAVAESGLENAISPAGARGVWQFMKATGRAYGLEITSEVDERNHLEKSTEAACAFLKKLHDRQGSWILAAAAYNGGPDRIRKEKEKQRADNFFEMNLAANETMQYVFRIVALKEVLQNPSNFEFYVAPEHLYQPLPAFTEIEVDKSIANLGDFAKKYGMSYRMLKIYNPWLRDNKLSVAAGKTYTIRIKK